MIFSPYITSTRLIDKVGSAIAVKIYTNFSAEVFASGASSFGVLKKLFARQQLQVFALPGLHAKIVLVDGHFVSIGSQNLTVRGSKNLEATLFNVDDKTANRVASQASIWTRDAVEVSPSMMLAMETALPPLRKLYRAFLAEARALDAKVEEHTAAAIEARLEAERQTMEMERELAMAQEAFRGTLVSFWKESKALFPDGEISEAFARRLSAQCTLIRNSFGRGPCRLKQVGDRVFFVRGLGWCWNNSGNSNTNKFVLTLAVFRCKQLVERAVKEEWWQQGWSYDDVVARLKDTAWGCVANLNDELYSGSYTREGDDLPFWGMSFDLSDFVRNILYYLPLKEVFDSWRTLDALQSKHSIGVIPPKM